MEARDLWASEHAEWEHAEPEPAEWEHAEPERAEPEHAELEHAELEHAEPQHPEWDPETVEGVGRAAEEFVVAPILRRAC